MADPNRSPPIDEAFKQRVRSHVQGGYSATEIASIFGRKVDQVRDAIKAMGGVRRIRAASSPPKVEKWQDGGF